MCPWWRPGFRNTAPRHTQSRSVSVSVFLSHIMVGHLCLPVTHYGGASLSLSGEHVFRCRGSGGWGKFGLPAV